MTKTPSSAESKEQLSNMDYWRSMLENITAPTPLMIDSIDAVNAAPNSASKEQSVAFDPEFSESLKSFLESHDIDGQCFLIGIWAILLARYSAEAQVTIGLNGLSLLRDSESIAPFCINITDGDTATPWMRRLQSSLEKLDGKSIPSLHDLKSLSGVDENAPLIENLLSFGAHNDAHGQIPLHLNYSHNSAAILKLTYHSPRFLDAAITRMLGHLVNLMQATIAAPNERVALLPLLTQEERQQMLVQWNQTSIDYPDDKCLHELFEEQVIKDPDAIAIIHDAERLTYRQLNEQANQLAAHLQHKGAGTGQLVAISLSRGLLMPVVMMAVAKSGAAYVPLDPSYPSDRLTFMLRDTEALILVTESDLRDSFSSFDGHVVLIDGDISDIEKHAKSNIDASVKPEDLAYVIYTSGSTGQPKGAVLNHQGRVNNFSDFNRRYDIGPGDRLLALASISFDMSVYDIFGTLMCGASAVIADASNILGAANWARLMQKHDITVWHSVPALMEMLVDHAETKPELAPASLRLVLLGGDWIPVALPDRLKRLVSGVHVVSMGGATEVSMDSTIYDIDEPSSDWKSIPYGFPMANQLTYVLDPELLPLPIGVPGELHLGGVGVGEGYWNRKELTAEKFIANPYRPSERLYKTGDLARFGDDGNLELLGRIDFQVKIRGFRIELGEIESRLRKHPGVRESVVLAKLDQNKNKRLVAYVLPDDDKETSDESQATQVQQWAAVYDHAYSKDDAAANSDETFKITSWDSSYTEQPYPESVMRTWVDSTVARIQSFKPKRVMEIGCGTGLLLLRIAPDCESYRGSDISDVALNYVAAQKEKLNLQQVVLEKRAGDDFSGLEKDSIDAVVLNSIVMDFPDLEYLTRVLSGAAELVSAGGVIFVGDVRDLRSIQLFQTSVQLSKARSALKTESLNQLIGQRLDNEEELLLDPAYFFALKDHIEAVTEVNIQLKRGRADNEMTKFRYDVSLHIGESKTKFVDPSELLDWQTGDYDLDKLQQKLNDQPDSVLAVRNVPNERLASDLIAKQLLQDNSCETVRELRRAINSESASNKSIDPEAIWQIAEELDRGVEIRCSASGNVGLFDVVFLAVDRNSNLNVASEWNIKPEYTLDNYANNPLLAMKRRNLIAKLRSYLGAGLPDYMVPSAFLVLDKFPLSPNGKLNRRALPEPDNLRPDLVENFVPPDSDLEKVVSELWCECLNLDRAGMRDGFIELGGNSLLATQVVSRIRDIFQIDLPLTYGIHSSLQELAGQIESAAKSKGMDAHETASVYLEVIGMTDKELEMQLRSQEETTNE